MKNWVSIAWNIGWVSDGVYRKVFKWVLAICNACDWCGFCDIRFYLQQNKITKILNEKSRRKIFVRVENSVYITWHRHRIIFSFLYFFLRLIVVWGPPTETAYKKTVGLAAVLLCASNRGRSQTAVLKLIISRPPLFYTHGGKGGTPCFFALSMPLICQKKPRHRTRIFWYWLRKLF